MSETPEFARVGLRYHTILSLPVYMGQPEAALCGTIFIRQNDQSQSVPRCLDCAILCVDFDRDEAESILADAEALAMDINHHLHLRLTKDGMQ